MPGIHTRWHTNQDIYNHPIVAPQHTRFRAHMCTSYDGKKSEWFGVTQGLRQAYVLSPLLMHVFFADVIRVVLPRFTDDEDIIRHSVHLEVDIVNGNDVSLACVLRAMWDKLYADDAQIVSKSAEGLTIIKTVTVTVFKTVGLTVSEKTTKTIILQ